MLNHKNSVLMPLFGNFMKSKPIQRIIILVCCVFVAIVGLMLFSDIFIYLNKTREITILIPRNNDENLRLDTEKAISVWEGNSLELHDYSSDNYNKSEIPYTLRDLLPQKKLSKFEPINDRILLQIGHIPNSYKLSLDSNEDIPMKLIYFHGSYRNFWVKEGQSYFLTEECVVNRCLATYDRKKGLEADAVVFINPLMPSRPPWPRRSFDQIWAVYSLESPSHTSSLSRYSNYLNWTMTYRRDSTITTPYFKFSYFNQPLQKETTEVNFAERKTKKVAWMVSNCRSVTSGRMTYARELAKYISVDIYGACGTLSCSKGRQQICNQMIKRDYKFYLAFESSKCLGYVTEKFSQNALGNFAVPIVLGVSREEMHAVAPPGSYIHVEDFESPQHLAEYLHKVDMDDNLYNNFFEWRRYGEMINTKVWCRLCSLLHEKDLPSVQQTDIENWWRKSGTCVGANIWN